VFSLPRFAHRMGSPQFVIYPSIDPLSDKNRELSPRQTASILGALASPRAVPSSCRSARSAATLIPSGW